MRPEANRDLNPDFRARYHSDTQRYRYYPTPTPISAKIAIRVEVSACGLARREQR